MKSSEALRFLKKHGWVEDRQSGSHIQLKHPDKPGVTLTFPFHGSNEIKKGLWQALLKQAGLK